MAPVHRSTFLLCFGDHLSLPWCGLRTLEIAFVWQSWLKQRESRYFSHFDLHDGAGGRGAKWHSTPTYLNESTVILPIGPHERTGEAALSSHGVTPQSWHRGKIPAPAPLKCAPSRPVQSTHKRPSSTPHRA